MVDLCAQSTESVSRSEDKFMTKEEYFRLARIGDRILCCSFLTILTLCFFFACYSATLKLGFATRNMQAMTLVPSRVKMCPLS